MKKQKKPFGSWPSSLSPQRVGGKTKRFGHLLTIDETIYWLEGRPDEGGRSVLMRKTLSGEAEELTPPAYSVKSKVHEYGGGDFLVSEGRIFFSNGPDQDVYEILGTKIKRITHAPQLRFADMVFDGHRQRLIAVCEDHSSDRSMPENRLVEISLKDDLGEIKILIEGDDFYAAPALSPCGNCLSYLSWSQPFMPWEAAALSVVMINEAGEPLTPGRQFGGEGVAVFQPLWHGSDLYFVIEQENWNNIAVLKKSQDYAQIDIIWKEAADFGRPHWVFGQRSFTFLDEHTIIASYFQEGVHRLASFDLKTKKPTLLDCPFQSFDMIDLAGDHIVGIAAKEDMPPTIISAVISELLAGFTIQRPSSEHALTRQDISSGRLVDFPTQDGGRAYALYYPPENAHYTGLEGELPPMVVSAHGGPTGMADRGLKLKIQYWTSRGFAFLDVDYRGSSGYGKSYREKLDGSWGVLDVQDVIDGTQWCVDQGLADQDKLVITGTSAGGLTVLNALAHHRLFSAGACYYGVSDLQALCADTHKFEADYVYRLTDTTPETAPDIFKDISPKNHIAKIDAPVILFQGDLDPIVPPDQSRQIFSELKAQGNIVSYSEFAGESHGFRGEESIKTALSQEYLFYAKVLGFEASFGDGTPPEISIENM